MLDLLDLVGGHKNRALLVEVFVQQRFVELLAHQDVEAERWFVQHQELGVNRHHEREVQLCHHPLRQFLDAAVALDVGARQELVADVTAEFRVCRGGQVDQLADADPPWQHGNVGDETDILHQLVTLPVRVEAQH